MSTPKEDTLSSRIVGFLSGFIPETSWTTLESDQFELIIEKLKCLDKTAIEDDIMAFIEKRKYRIGTLSQSFSGAGWTIFGNITIRPNDVKKCLEPYVLSLILHEIFHIKRQSILLRLSMKGELDAWQYQYRIYPLLKPDHEIGDAYGGKSKDWQDLSSLSGNSRTDLEKAREYMVNIAPGYRAYALPVYPLPQEIGYYLKKFDLAGLVGMVRNLIRGARGEKAGRDNPKPA